MVVPVRKWPWNGLDLLDSISISTRNSSIWWFLPSKFPLTKHTFLPTKNISMISRRRGLYDVHLFVRAPRVFGLSILKPLWIQLGTPPCPVTRHNQDFSYFRMIPCIVGDKLVLTFTTATDIHWAQQDSKFQLRLSIVLFVFWLVCCWFVCCPCCMRICCKCCQNKRTDRVGWAPNAKTRLWYVMRNFPQIGWINSDVTNGKFPPKSPPAMSGKSSPTQPALFGNTSGFDYL